MGLGRPAQRLLNCLFERAFLMEKKIRIVGGIDIFDDVPLTVDQEEAGDVESRLLGSDADIAYSDFQVAQQKEVGEVEASGKFFHGLGSSCVVGNAHDHQTLVLELAIKVFEYRRLALTDGAAGLKELQEDNAASKLGQ